MSGTEPPNGDEAFFHPVGANGRRRLRPGGAVVWFVVCVGSFFGTASIAGGFLVAMGGGLLTGFLVVGYGLTRGFDEAWWSDDDVAT